MFENAREIQSEIISQLEADIQNDLVAQSSLFYGVEFTGKLTTALDLASVLTGQEIPQLLKSQGAAIITSRNSKLRLDATFSLWEKYSNSYFRNKVIQEVRIFTSQFQDSISTLTKKESENIRLDKIGEILLDLENERDYKTEEVKRIVKDLKSYLTPLINKNQKGSALSIEMIRLLQLWLSTSSGDNKKVAILENIEDISVGAKNSLLKLLEEPPENAYLILISNNPNKLLDTILSRVRKYEFKAIDKKKAHKIISTKYYSEGDDFYSFYLQKAYGDDFSKLDKMASYYLSSLLEGKRMDVEALNEIVDVLDRYQTYNYFYTLVSERLKEATLAGSISYIKAKKLLNIINERINIGQTYNQNQHNILDYVYRECCNGN